eukprot:COSAG04_NODE_15370_length_534_cov_0.710345_1_plen_177_part_11
MATVATAEPEEEIDLDDPDLNEAALKIQAVQRGKTGRREFEQKKSAEILAAEKAAVLTPEDIERRAAGAAEAEKEARAAAASVAVTAESEAKQAYANEMAASPPKEPTPSLAERVAPDEASFAVTEPVPQVTKSQSAAQDHLMDRIGSIEDTLSRLQNRLQTTMDKGAFEEAVPEEE